MKQKTNTNTHDVKTICALILTLAGIILLSAGIILAPRGEIHNSVLVAFGEISTFAGALFGIHVVEKKRLTNKINKNAKL